MGQRQTVLQTTGLLDLPDEVLELVIREVRQQQQQQRLPDAVMPPLARTCRRLATLHRGTTRSLTVWRNREADLLALLDPLPPPGTAAAAAVAARWSSITQLTLPYVTQPLWHALTRHCPRLERLVLSRSPPPASGSAEDTGTPADPESLPAAAWLTTLVCRECPRFADFGWVLPLCPRLVRYEGPVPEPHTPFLSPVLPQLTQLHLMFWSSRVHSYRAQLDALLASDILTQATALTELRLLRAAEEGLENVATEQWLECEWVYDTLWPLFPRLQILEVQVCLERPPDVFAYPLPFAQLRELDLHGVGMMRLLLTPETALAHGCTRLERLPDLNRALTAQEVHCALQLTHLRRLDGLPVELLAESVAPLPPHDSLQAVLVKGKRVSAAELSRMVTAFRQLTTVRLHLTDALDLPALAALTPLPHLASLSLSFDDTEQIRPLSFRLPQVTSFTMAWNTVSADCVACLLQTLPGLEELILRPAFDPAMLVNTLPRLRRLQVWAVAGWKDLAQLPRLAPALQALNASLETSEKDSLQALLPVVQRWPHLRVLQLEGQMSVDAPSMRRLLAAVPGLVELRLGLSVTVAPEACEVLAAAGQRLRVLELSSRGLPVAVRERMAQCLSDEALRWLTVRRTRSDAGPSESYVAGGAWQPSPWPCVHRRFVAGRYDRQEWQLEEMLETSMGVS